MTAKKRRRIKDTIQAQANRLVVTADDLQITPVRRKKPTKRRKGRAGG